MTKKTEKTETEKKTDWSDIETAFRGGTDVAKGFYLLFRGLFILFAFIIAMVASTIKTGLDAMKKPKERNGTAKSQ